MPKVSTIRAALRDIIEAVDVSPYTHGLQISALTEEPTGSIDDPALAWPHLTYLLRTPATQTVEKTRAGERATTDFELLISFLVRPGTYDNPVSRDMDEAWDLAEAVQAAVVDDADRNWSAVWGTTEVLDPPSEGKSGIIIRFAVHHPMGG